MPAFRWKLYDPNTDTEIRFPLNPREGALPQREKVVTVNSSTQGAPIIFEGRQKVQTVSATGVILEQSHYDFFVAWYDLDHEVRITDDLGNVWWAYLTKFSPKRRHATSHPWSAEYDLEMLVTRWDNV